MRADAAAAAAADFKWERTEGGWKVRGYRGDGGDVGIPGEVDGEPVVLIGANAFEDCRSIVSIAVPGSVGYIGNYAFWGCSGLERAALPQGIETLNLGTFMGCTSLRAVDIPPSVTEIGDGAFNGCTSLVSLEVPRGVQSIGDSAFRGCTSLETVYLPESVTSVARSAYRSCPSLRSVTVHDTLAYIGPRAFQDCPALKKAVILGDDPERTVAAFRNHSLTYLVADYVTRLGLMSFDDAKRLLTSKFAPEVLLGARVAASCYPQRLGEVPTKLALTKALASAGRTEELRACAGRPGYLSKPAIMKCIDAATAGGHPETVAYLVDLAAGTAPAGGAAQMPASGLEL